MVSDTAERKLHLLSDGLNPCYNGIWSLTNNNITTRIGDWRLNPCSKEYGLWHNHAKVIHADKFCLNPCSNGIWSLTLVSRWLSVAGVSLNPCSNGIWSLTEYPWYSWFSCVHVLILVLMEYGLWPLEAISALSVTGLNPCSNGIWSLTSWKLWGSLLTE